MQLDQLVFAFAEPMYKVRWKAFEEVYENQDRYPYGKKMVGYSDKTIIRTTAGLMTKEEAQSFAEFVKTGLYEYAGEIEIFEPKQTIDYES